MPTRFRKGDIVFGPTDDGRTALFKIMRIDPSEDGRPTYHLLTYQPVQGMPALDVLDDLPVRNWHFATKDIDTCHFLINRIATEREMKGYLEHLQNSNFELWCEESGHSLSEIVAESNTAFERGNQFYDQGNNAEAVAAYMDAIGIYPNHSQAIDNMGLAKMRQQKYNDAIDDFRWSLSIVDKNPLAEFSIGECYFKMELYASALDHFDNALQLDPKNTTIELYREKALFFKDGGTPEELEVALNPPQPEPEIIEEPKAQEPSSSTTPNTDEKTKKAWWKFSKK